MRSLTRDGFNRLLAGVTELTLTDFPDHPNVGDSAIAAGEFAYFREASVAIPETRCIGTFSPTVLESRRTVGIHGGGNIAGAFDGIDDHRNLIAQRLRSDTLLIQMPQSVHFFTEKGRQRFETEFATRSNLRFAARDRESFNLVKDLIEEVFLVPDAVHHLGAIQVSDPSQRVVSLIRRDQETSSVRAALEHGIDWPKDTFSTGVATSFRWKARRLGTAGRWLNPSTARWGKIAEGRLSRGLALLSRGETVITDRLHGMLLALQSGRRVVAVDNNNRKLSKYAETWFGDAQPDLVFARDVDEAGRLAKLDLS